jgi:Tfp pilus assembly protein PilX
VKCFSNRSRRCYRRSQRGIVLVAVLVLLTVSLTLFGIWARQAVLKQSHLETQQRRLQAVRLAEAGVERAVRLRATDSTFNTQVWSVPSLQLDGKHAAEVRINVTPEGSEGTLRYQATAVFPVGDIRCVQITKSVKVSRPISKDRS